MKLAIKIRELFNKITCSVNYVYPFRMFVPMISFNTISKKGYSICIIIKSRRSDIKYLSGLILILCKIGCLLYHSLKQNIVNDNQNTEIIFYIIFQNFTYIINLKRVC